MGKSHKIRGTRISSLNWENAFWENIVWESVAGKMSVGKMYQWETVGWENVRVHGDVDNDNDQDW